MDNMENWIWGVIVLPVVIGVFKSELASLWTAWSVYHARPFDDDGNPDTIFNCEVFNGSNGEWVPVKIVGYRMSLNKNKRGVWVEYENGTKERIPLVKWANVRVRT